MPLSIDAEQACFRLAHMPAPRGWSKEDLILGYTDSLSGIPPEVVVRVINRFLKGGYEPSEINPNFAPSPPALAVLCRKAAPEKRDRVVGRLYAFRTPNSPVLEANIKHDDAKVLVSNGMYPRGAIWCPHDMESADWGTLYAPDPGWAKPARLKTEDEARAASEAEEEDRRKSKSFQMSDEERKRAGFHFSCVFMDTRASDRAAFFSRLPSAEIERWVLSQRAKKGVSA